MQKKVKKVSTIFFSAALLATSISAFASASDANPKALSVNNAPKNISAKINMAMERPNPNFGIARAEVIECDQCYTNCHSDSCYQECYGECHSDGY
jgi:hypothetical protein